MGDLPLILLTMLVVAYRCIVRSVLEPYCKNLYVSWIQGNFALLGMIEHEDMQVAVIFLLL